MSHPRGLMAVFSVLAIAASPSALAGDPTAKTAAIEAFDNSGGKSIPCGQIKEIGRFAGGRCKVVAQDWETDFSIRTAVGRTHFGTCSVTVDINLAGDGELVLDNLRIGGVSPCNDIWPCVPPALRNQLNPTSLPTAARFTPWRGELTDGDGERFVGEIDTCFDTCVGRYEGRTRVELVRGGEKGWILRFPSTGVGTGGLEIDAEMEFLSGPKIDVRRR